MEIIFSTYAKIEDEFFFMDLECIKCTSSYRVLKSSGERQEEEQRKKKTEKSRSYSGSPSPSPKQPFKKQKAKRKKKKTMEGSTYLKQCVESLLLSFSQWEKKLKVPGK